MYNQNISLACPGTCVTRAFHNLLDHDDSMQYGALLTHVIQSNVSGGHAY